MTLTSRDIYETYIASKKAKNIWYSMLYCFYIFFLISSVNLIFHWLESQIDLRDIIFLLVACLIVSLIVGPLRFLTNYNLYVLSLKNTETASYGNPVNTNKKYIQYTGKVKKIRHSLKSMNFIVRFDNGKEHISVIIDKALASKMSVGQTWTLGYIDNTLVNIRPGVYTLNII